MIHLFLHLSYSLILILSHNLTPVITFYLNSQHQIYGILSKNLLFINIIQLFIKQTLSFLIHIYLIYDLNDHSKITYSYFPLILYIYSFFSILFLMLYNNDFLYCFDS
jgi:hypothetical protein